MRLHDFINLPDECYISFEDGQSLHKDIMLNGVTNLTGDQSRRLRDYLDNCILHGSVEPKMVTGMINVCEILKKKE